MKNEKYISPINGEELSVGTDDLLHSQSGLVFALDNSNKVIPLTSPTNGSQLYLDKDGLFYSNNDNTKYQVNSGSIVPLVSPIHGGDLRKSENGLFQSTHDSLQYMVSNDGHIKPLVDPFSGGNLTQNDNGTYLSETTGKNFALNNGNFVPLYIPDKTAESAHIEDGFLVGNETGRRFAIDNNGMILTPEYIEHQQQQTQRLSELQQRQQEGKLADLNNQKPKEYTKDDFSNMISPSPKIESLSDEEIKNIQAELNPNSVEVSTTPLSQTEIKDVQSVLSKGHGLSNDKIETLPKGQIESIQTQLNPESVEAEHIIPFTQDEIAIIQNALQNDTQLSAPIDPYRTYRESMAQVFEQEKDQATLLHSQFMVQYGEKALCHHQLLRINGEEKTVLQQKIFDFDDSFRTGMLEPAITDYALRNPLMSSQIVANDQNLNISSFQTYSENNNALFINNIDTNYANSISNAISTITPTIYNQQQALAAQVQMVQNSGVGLTKSMGGFTNILLLAAITGFICGLGVFIGILLIK